MAIITAFSFMNASQVSALETQKFEVFGKVATFELPSDWKSVNKDIAVPLKLIGPMHEGRRPVITFVPIDLKNEKIILDDVKKAEEGYKVSRLSWLQKFNGSAISFYPLKVYKENENEVHQFGYSYIFNNTNFNENSYYVYCNKNTYHIKSLVQLEHGKKWDRLVHQIVNSFGCK
jgi:hypothetical protein